MRILAKKIVAQVAQLRPSDDELTSHWPLPKNGFRFLTPKQLAKRLLTEPLTRDLIPLAMGFYPKARHHAMQRSEHDTYLMLYCTAGIGTLTIGGKESPVAPGDLLILPKGIIHAYQADALNPWSLYWLHFDGSLANQYLPHRSNKSAIVHLGLHTEVIGHFEELFRAREQGLGVTNFLYLSAVTKTLLANIILLCEQPHRSRSLRNHLQPALDYMREHLQEDINLDKLARLTNLSKYHFIRAFKRQTSYTPIHYLIQLRMERASFLLDNTQASVKTIAIQLGYQDPLYFSRLFKKTFGLSPRAYREQHSA